MKNIAWKIRWQFIRWALAGRGARWLCEHGHDFVPENFQKAANLALRARIIKELREIRVKRVIQAELNIISILLRRRNE